VARSSGRRNGLYQLEYKHFIPGHADQSGEILESWYSMVGSGEWEVGEEGVMCGIEKFGEADTEGGFWTY
jgi:hypothetical protein